MLDFPASPANGQLFTGANGVIYQWNAAGALWLNYGVGMNNAIIASTPPSNPTAGQLWWSQDLGQLFIWYTDPNTSQWVPAAPAPSSGAGTMSSGMIMDFAGVTAPLGWYLCDGSLKNRTTDASLFAAIGTVYGAGDGSTTFALPDCRGRAVAGVDAAGTTLPGYTTLGTKGGAATHTLTVAEMPSHQHGSVGGARVVYWDAVGAAGAVLQGGTGAQTWLYTNTDFMGGGGGHSIVQPTIAMNKIIKA